MAERFITREISVGNRRIGGSQEILIQSMTTTNTVKVEETVVQAKDLAEAGCEVVRITAPTVDDAVALGEIVDQLRAQNCDVPIVADIHFLPKAAFIAAKYVDKVRINPGNFADRKMFKVREYTDDQYSEEIKRIEEKFEPLVLLLKENKRALRIGTNHGSLSDRVMNRFGDSPEGMVESAFEYAEICRKNDFHNFCFSMKSSNVSVMVQVYRLLVDRQREKGWDYPIHLGVTEAGDGEDARIKSSIGIGSLLAEGIGDTIRVSLTEAPIKEVPVARAIANRFNKKSKIYPREFPLQENAESEKNPPLVWIRAESYQALGDSFRTTELRPDVILWTGDFDSVDFLKDSLKKLSNNPELKVAFEQDSFFKLSETDQEKIEFFVYQGSSDQADHSKAIRRALGLDDLKSGLPINPRKTLLSYALPESFVGSSLERLIEASLQVGTAFLDLACSGVLLENYAIDEALSLSFGILQATRRRMSRTEYIACPSCGRTLFDLEETTARIKQYTNHLKGVKIAVMGCIVNGPGEMADADFGYVGGAPGKVNLYVEKDCVERNIASAEAPERLVELIKKHGRWVEPEVSKVAS